jgi:hypothetical protein
MPLRAGCRSAGRVPNVPEGERGTGMDDMTGVECGLPDVAGLTIDQLRTAPGSVLAVALERLRAEAAESDEDEYTSWQASA